MAEGVTSGGWKLNSFSYKEMTWIQSVIENACKLLFSGFNQHFSYFIQQTASRKLKTRCTQGAGFTERSVEGGRAGVGCTAGEGKPASRSERRSRRDCCTLPAWDARPCREPARPA